MAFAQTLRQVLHRPSLDVFVGAHDPLTALLIERAGLPGVWASSLTMSCANGYRDNNEMSLAEVMTSLENMTRRLTVPLIFDADTGYGQFHHTQILFERAARRGVAGICLEDKAAPKMNSFYNASQQRLEPIDSFCGKLRAARAVDNAPVLIARTESLILGYSINEALHRARAYADAGAEAILIHSKASTFDDIKRFADAWANHLPLICVPTTYAQTPPAAMHEAGISIIIWANHTLRVAIDAMQKLLGHIAQTSTVEDTTQPMVSVKTLFDLQDLSGFVEDIQRFAPHVLRTPDE